MYLAPASADSRLNLSKATNVAIGIDAVSSPIKKNRKLPAEIMKYMPSSVVSVRK